MPPNQFWYCSMLVIIVLSAVLCSSLLLVSMTFERFYSIIRPHKAASFNTIKRAKVTIVCIFLFSFLYYIPHLFISTNNGRICIPNKIASGNVYGELYYWLSEVISFIFPFVSLLSMNSVIIHTLRQRDKDESYWNRRSRSKGRSHKKSRPTSFYNTLACNIWIFNIDHSCQTFGILS